MMSEIALNHVGGLGDLVALLFYDLAGQRASNTPQSIIMERR
jgi:hypothetical protein